MVCKMYFHESHLRFFAPFVNEWINWIAYAWQLSIWCICIHTTHTLSHTHKHRFLWMYIKYINVHTYINICIKYRIHKFNFALPQCVLSVFFFALCKCKCKCISENKNGGRKIRNVKSHLTDICYYYINKRIYNLLTMQ